MTAFLSILVIMAVGFLGGLAVAQQAPPQPAAAPANAPTVPDWVARYAGLQEQAARTCHIQLSQEQTKNDELTKQLADAKSAAAAAAPKK